MSTGPSGIALKLSDRNAFKQKKEKTVFVLGQEVKTEKSNLP